MNNKAEIVDQYKELASMYTKKTGVQVDIQTGAAGTYDATMKSPWPRTTHQPCSTSPARPVRQYQKYVEPLNAQRCKSYTIILPYAAEWYGIIYNPIAPKVMR